MMTPEQEATIRYSGWIVTNYYGDGVIRMAAVGSGVDDPFCFVSPDGSCGRVLTWRAVGYETALRERGIVIRDPSGRQR